jgi:hypothetical protein
MSSSDCRFALLSATPGSRVCVLLCVRVCGVPLVKHYTATAAPLPLLHYYLHTTY